jgi:hypothetical protein
MESRLKFNGRTTWGSRCSGENRRNRDRYAKARHYPLVNFGPRVGHCRNSSPLVQFDRMEPFRTVATHKFPPVFLLSLAKQSGAKVVDPVLYPLVLDNSNRKARFTAPFSSRQSTIHRQFR